MHARSVARGLLIGALAVFGLLVFAGFAAAQTPSTSAVLGQNGSTGAGAASGPVVGANNAAIGAGPAAGSVLGTSQSQQLGDNTVTVNQSSTAKSGDAVAGSQVTGVVGGSSTVMNSNSSIGAVALSGPVASVNNAVVAAGPKAGSILGSAQTGQVGDNNVNVHQRSDAESGDAVAGSQVTGIVGSGAIVSNMNASRFNAAVSGPVLSTNAVAVGTGPSAAAVGIFGPNASAGQVGDNDAVITQSSVARTGDALAGSQVTGIVGDGDSTVQNSNSSRFNLALSFPAVSANVAAVNAGPTAATAGLLLSNAQTSQLGDNRVVLAQESGAESGDALAGSQVTGLVSSEMGHITVSNQQSSDFDFAASAPAVAVNVSPIAAGPTAVSAFGSARTQQIGDNNVLASQSVHSESGDALAGSGVTGVVGGSDVTVMNQQRSFGTVAVTGIAIGGNVAPIVAGPAAASVGGILGGSMVSQFGDNDVALDQDVHAGSGDALAGSQVTGVVGSGDVTVMNSNSAVAQVALSGPVVAGNIDALLVGPTAAHASLLGGNASVSQFGSNAAAVAQSVDAESGDAVAGSQVTGVVGNGDVVVANQNSSLGSLAVSGPVLAGNVLGANVGPTALSLGFLANASASQFGDNDMLLSQDVSAHSGDAVAGSQITGAVAGIDPVIMQSNASTGSLGLSGIVAAGNTAGGNLGATALAPLPLSNANTSQAGNSRLAGSQSLDSESGDGVSGSQIVGSVSGPGATAHGMSSIDGGLSADVAGDGAFTASTGSGIAL